MWNKNKRPRNTDLYEFWEVWGFCFCEGKYFNSAFLAMAIVLDFRPEIIGESIWDTWEEHNFIVFGCFIFWRKRNGGGGWSVELFCLCVLV